MCIRLTMTLNHIKKENTPTSAYNKEQSEKCDVLAFLLFTDTIQK